MESKINSFQAQVVEERIRNTLKRLLAKGNISNLMNNEYEFIPSNFLQTHTMRAVEIKLYEQLTFLSSEILTIRKPIDEATAE